jgi:hypothetical protein
MKHFRILLLVCVITVIVSMPRKQRDQAEDADKNQDSEKAAPDSGRLAVVADPDEATLSLVRPIRRELGRYTVARQAELGTAPAGPFRGNVGDAIRASIGHEITAETLRLFGDGLLAPYFREGLNSLGMTKSELDDARRYAMEGNIEAITRAMVARGYAEFIMSADGVRTIIGHLVRNLLERQDRLVETGPRFSPMKASHDQASRLPAILDFHRWRVSVLPNLGPHGYVRITGQSIHID